MNVGLTTYWDLIEHVAAYMGGNADSKTLATAKRAIQAAYRELPDAHGWRYFLSQGRVVTESTYSTGTVAYDHCVTPEHEALTRQGWKTYDQLNVGDEILAYDHDKEVCSWQAIEQIHTHQYEGDILDVQRKGRSVLRCTPNHRIPVWERYGKPRKWRKKWVLASELTNEHTTPLAAPINVESSGPLTPKQAAMLAWVVTDGHSAFKHWGTPRIIQSRRANPCKCHEIDALVGTTPHFAKNGIQSWPIPTSDARAWKAHAKCKDDMLPLVLMFGVHQADAAIRAMLLAEASTNEKNNQKVFTQWGDNKPVAEAFQACCLLSGIATNISVGDFHCESFGRDYGIKRRYACAVRHSGGIKLAKSSSWVPYRGVVWCPQVRTGAWVVRCNGAVMITGNSGGAFERMLTLTDGTWPSWALFGEVLISSVPYQVATRESDTIITLHPASNPGADVAAGTTYQLFQDTFHLPTDWRRSYGKFILGTGVLEYVSPAAWLELRNYNLGSGQPHQYTIRDDPNYVGCMTVSLYPWPDSAYKLDFMYQRRPRPLLIDKYETGTVTASGLTVTGDGTTFSTTRHPGTAIRLSSDATDYPTGPEGENFFNFERTVQAVTNATSLAVDASLGAISSGVKFRISDPADVEQGAMLNALLRLCEYHAAVLTRMENIGEAKALYRDALRTAMEADNRRSEARIAGGGSGHMPKWSATCGDDA